MRRRFRSDDAKVLGAVGDAPRASLQKKTFSFAGLHRIEPEFLSDSIMQRMIRINGKEWGIDCASHRLRH